MQARAVDMLRISMFGATCPLCGRSARKQKADTYGQDVYFCPNSKCKVLYFKASGEVVCEYKTA